MQHVDPSKRRSGFTLVEVLTVIAIMVVLFGMLMPTFSRVQETKNSAVCANNLRQIGSSLSMYASRNDGFLPAQNQAWSWGYWDQWDSLPAWPAAETWGLEGGILGYQYGFLIDECGASDKLFICPSTNMQTLAPAYWTYHTYRGKNPTYKAVNNYQYYGQAAASVVGTLPNTGNFSGKGGPMPYSPFGVEMINSQPPYGAKLNHYTNNALSGGNGQYDTYVYLQGEDTSVMPLMSDTCFSTTWAVYFSHGDTLAHSQSNVLYQDGHVDLHKIDTNKYFEYTFTWGNCYHYR